MRRACVRICNISQQGYHHRVPGIDEAAGHFPRRMDGLTLDNDQSDTASCAFLVIGNVRIGRQAIKRAKGCKMRLENETIAEFNSTNAKRTEKQREPLGLHRCGSVLVGHER